MFFIISTFMYSVFKVGYEGTPEESGQQVQILAGVTKYNQKIMRIKMRKIKDGSNCLEHDNVDFVGKISFVLRL